MASKNNNKNGATNRLQDMGLLNEKTVRRKEQDLEKYFKEKVAKDRLIILNTLRLVRENYPNPVIVYQTDY